MVVVAAVNDIDVDSIVQPMLPEQLRMVPLYMMVELVNLLQLVKKVKLVCWLGNVVVSDLQDDISE